jgi:hypothetical protein
VGPGSYAGKQQRSQSLRRDILLPQPFGSNAQRFKEQGNTSPAPGEYNELNRWNKRTFNLKFLNGQSQAQLQKDSFQQPMLNE